MEVCWLRRRRMAAPIVKYFFSELEKKSGEKRWCDGGGWKGDEGRGEGERLKGFWWLRRRRMAAPIYIIILFLTPGDAMIDSDENAISRSHFWDTFLDCVNGHWKHLTPISSALLLFCSFWSCRSKCQNVKMSKCQAEYLHFALSLPWEKNYYIYDDTRLAYSSFKGFCNTYNISTL